ncbi:MAG: hypothetical protein VZR00_04790 [Lachnospiraceae bacterium]|nr:hypothetical protein [Lachnospiraceae bacterium]
MQTITYQEIPLNDFCNYTMKKSCYYVVFTFTTAAGKSASSTVYLITQPKVLIKKTKSSVKSRSVVVYWKKVPKAKKYKVYYSKDNKKWKKMGTTKKTSFKLKKGVSFPIWKHRYIKVRAYGHGGSVSCDEEYYMLYRYKKVIH